MKLPIAGMGLGIYTDRQCACARQGLNNKVNKNMYLVERELSQIIRKFS